MSIEFTRKFDVRGNMFINAPQTPYSYGRNGHVQRAAWRVDLSEVLWTEPLAKTCKVPAIGPWPSPSPLPHLKRWVVAAAFALACGPSAAQQSDGWSRSGEFNLAGGFTSTSVWSAGRAEWRQSDAFERSVPSIPAVQDRSITLRQNAEPLDQLLDVIASAEAGPAGYDAIHMSATRLHPAPPTRLTISQIFTWIDATPRQHHAIGRYQFIPSTLARLVEIEGIPLGTRFTPSVQRRATVTS